MKPEEAMFTIQRAAYGSSLSALCAPTDEQIKSFGERVAASVMENDPTIEFAEYDHSTMSVRVRFKAELSERQWLDAIRVDFDGHDRPCEALASRDPGQVKP